MILIKFASRGRSDFFRRAIANITNTIHTRDYMILVTADLDDSSMHNEQMQFFCSSHDHVTLVHGKSESKVDAINRDMEFVEEWDWRILVNFSDDMHFVTPGWDNIMKQRIKDTWGESTDFFAHFNDGYTKDLLPTMSVIGRDYYKRDGYIYHPSYKSFSCDAEAMYVAMMRERHKYFDDCFFLHQHPTNTPIRNDDTYRKNSLATEHDTHVYFSRLVGYFGEPSGREILKTRPELKQYL